MKLCERMACVTSTLDRYQRIAPFYDLLDFPFEYGRYRKIRPLLFAEPSGLILGSSGNRVDETNGKCGLKPHGYWVFWANSSKRRRRLWDTYTFPGFRPQPTVRGVFGDPKARIITLARRAKKRFAGAAGEFIRVGTTGVYGRFAICRAATRASSWRLRSGGCDAAVAAR